MDKNLHDKILIIDFGSQVTQLIARRVREEKVYCEIVPLPEGGGSLPRHEAQGRDPVGRPGLGARHRCAAGARRDLFAGLPVLGICYGEQAMAAQLGGHVEGGHHREFGRAEVDITADSAAVRGRLEKGEKYPVWMSHGDRVTKLPEVSACSASSPNAPIAIIGDEARNFYATQFHLEVDAHAAGRRAHPQFRAQDRGPDRRLDHARLQGRGDRENPQAGGQGPA